MRRALGSLALAALAACSSEPLRPPAVPVVAQYTAGAVAEDRLAPGRDIPAQWWTLFRSPALDALVRRSLDNSPTLARVQARLRQAEEDLGARSGATLPRVDARLSANRIDVDPQSVGVPLPVAMPLDLYLASVSVSYTFDFAGGTRRELEGLRAEVDHQAYELEAARLMLAGNVVTTAIREASLREQLAQGEAIVALQARQLVIAQRMEELGGAARLDVLAQQRELAQARATLPDLRRDLERMRHRLAVYAGLPPAAPDLPVFRLSELQLPDPLPLSLPSQLARQRPDIRAAEAVLARAGAQVGVATAHLYPQLTLSAQLGTLSTSGDGLFGAGTGFSILGASLVQPLFRGGELQARRRAAIAAYEQAGAAYQEAVLQGFQNVADALRALEADAARFSERTDAVGRARGYCDILAARLQAGGVSQAALLEATRHYHRALQEQAQAAADRYADSAALLQALGGGWWQQAERDRSRPVLP
ncbi:MULTISPECIES: efflux transporter outer membrane subunit [Ramlibacter]|uniref:Efflux transporter outer membrane subunit n=1 Tax=Ramlibacter pinisoli TaxID=2682844 RepID=A0A6N8IM27_9BURK|nr:MULTISPECIES: efflux transporter outer membrane subunit [Ramlibacter]MBA2960548.1 efflux transporter outer membrane subunit [Ramlibacter sp. CGMCC 1.13660]MVQ27879.1 efflux transporter outer membrane subunit [Ramlibacter pinisoli]